MKPTIGRIVHYVLSQSDDVHTGEQFYRNAEGQIVPAIVVAVWSESCVNLVVFLDGYNHGHDKVRNPDKPGGFEHVAAVNRWVTSRTYSESGQPGTWHWPPQQPVEARPPQPDFTPLPNFGSVIGTLTSGPMSDSGSLSPALTTDNLEGASSGSTDDSTEESAPEV